MKFKKLVLYDLQEGSFEPSFIEQLKKYSESISVVYSKGDYTKTLAKKDLEGADALITHAFDHYDASLLSESSLQYIGAAHTDVSGFPIEVLKKKNITVTNVPDYSTEAVAELTISALLNITRKTFHAMQKVKNGGWGPERLMGWELKGKTIGIVGMGNIGNRVAEIAEAFGMNVVYYSRTKKESTENKGWKFCPLEELLKKSDVVTLHCPLSNETKNILNKERIEMLKRGAVILNSARSELVDLDVVYKRCEEKSLEAWFEAIEEESVRKKFQKLETVYLTPHYGWLTQEAQVRLRESVIKNMQLFLEGKSLRNS